MKKLNVGRMVVILTLLFSAGHDNGHAQSRFILTNPAIRTPAPAKPAPAVRPGTATPETYQGGPAFCPDNDGDGHSSAACGGSDCDDSNPARYPGATEIPNKVDEDCDETTVGNRDQDGDGFIDMNACNGLRCGNDCDDSVFTVHPRAEELPNRIDDNCDGIVDNLRGSWWSPR